MVQFVGVKDMARLVGSIGAAQFLTGLAEYLEADFRRWLRRRHRAAERRVHPGRIRRSRE